MEFAQEMIEAKAFRTFIRVYSLRKSDQLSTNIELNLHKPFISVVMTSACSAWRFATDTHVIQFQSLQDKVLRNLDNFPRCSLVLHPSVCT
jgi:hypothetical protein